jgi:hypothetical protein
MKDRWIVPIKSTLPAWQSTIQKTSLDKKVHAQIEVAIFCALVVGSTARSRLVQTRNSCA